MLTTPEPLDSFSPRPSLRGLLLFYSLLIIYGSFLPFYFNLDPNFVEWRWLTFLAAPLVPGVRRLSMDVVSNVLLFLPWGFLWVAAGKDQRIFRSHAAPFLVGALGLLLGLSIECGQTLSPFRNPSKLDALCNGAGAVLGATLAYFFLRAVQKNRAPRLRRLLSERPSLILLALLLLALVFEAAYPFRITLDISMVAASLNRAWFAHSKRRIFWPGQDVWVAKILFFAAIGYLTRLNLRRADGTARSAQTWLLCCLVALVLEGLKLLVVGRTPLVENIVLGSAGALLGVSVVPKLAASGVVQKYPKKFLLLLSIGLIAYFELTPFVWVNPTEVPWRIAMIERIPFRTYYYMHPSSALFDFAKKLFLSIPMGFIIAACPTPTQHSKPRLWRSTVAGAVLALLFEAGQISLRSRTPSVTDIVLIGFGSWLGAVAFAYYRATTRVTQPLVSSNDSECVKK